MLYYEPLSSLTPTCAILDPYIKRRYTSNVLRSST